MRLLCLGKLDLRDPTLQTQKNYVSVKSIKRLAPKRCRSMFRKRGMGQYLHGDPNVCKLDPTANFLLRLTSDF